MQSLSRDHASVQLNVKARKVNDWPAVDGAADPSPVSPTDGDGPEESITLTPSQPPDCASLHSRNARANADSGKKLLSNRDPNAFGSLCASVHEKRTRLLLIKASKVMAGFGLH